MKTWLSLIFLLGIALCRGVAQNDDFFIDIVGKKIEKSNLAIPVFKVDRPTPDLNLAKDTLTQVLRADMENSGYFHLTATAMMQQVPSPHAGPINFAEWGSIDAQHLIVGNLSGNGDKMRVEVRLYEVATKQVILGKAYSSKPKLARKTAHIIADDILMQLRNTRFASYKVLFNRQTLKKSGDIFLPVKEIWMMDYDGKNQAPLTRGGIAVMPTAVRMGQNTTVAYCSYDNPHSINASYGIYYKPNLASRPRPLFVDRNRRATAPAISPDGKKVLFSMNQDDNVDIYSMNMDGTDLLRLTRHPGIDTNPSWSPSGHAILFTSDRPGQPQIYMMDADGLNQHRITYGDNKYNTTYNDLAVWNPRYDYIAYVSRFRNRFDIFIMDLKSSDNYRITDKQGDNEDPCWSPDGERLIFTSNRSGTWQLYFVNRNGENLQQLTNSGENRKPVWIQ